MTWSAWSHVDLIDETSGKPVLIGAVAPHGVAVESLEHRLSLASRAAVVEFPVADVAAVIDAARSQMAKPYDWLGCAGIALRNRDWQQTDSWFCSELVAWAFAAGKSPLFREDEVARITPQHLWMLANPATESDRPMDFLKLA